MKLSRNVSSVLRIACLVSLACGPSAWARAIAAEDDPEAAKKKELEKLLGEWRVKSFTYEGKEEQTDRFVWTIKRNSIVIKYDSRGNPRFFGSDTGLLDYTLELGKDRTVLKTKVASPGNIGATRTMLYRIDGDTLTVVYNDDPDKVDAIPESLDAKNGSGRHLTTLTRVRKPKKK